MISNLSRIKNRVMEFRNEKLRQARIQKYLKSGRVPWSIGYLEYREEQIKEALKNTPSSFTNWGKNLDERIVEIPWVFKKLSKHNSRLLDAGSSLNHSYILDHVSIKNKELTICTYFPEAYSRVHQRISYVFADLRELPFKDGWFDEIACVSTIEHIEMDNSIYGYESTIPLKSIEKSYSYIIAIQEMVRVLKKGGQLLLTFPFGKFENHGFFQQFDEELLNRLISLLNRDGGVELSFFKYSLDGWNQEVFEKCIDAQSFNPHTGVGKNDDGAAHSRAICCISFNKSLE